MVLFSDLSSEAFTSSEEALDSDVVASGGAAGSGRFSRVDRDYVHAMAGSPLPRVVTRTKKKSVTVTIADIQRLAGRGAVQFNPATSTGQHGVPVGHSLRDHITQLLLQQVYYQRDNNTSMCAQRCATK